MTTTTAFPNSKARVAKPAPLFCRLLLLLLLSSGGGRAASAFSSSPSAATRTTTTARMTATTTTTTTTRLAAATTAAAYASGSSSSNSGASASSTAGRIGIRIRRPPSRGYYDNLLLSDDEDDDDSAVDFATVHGGNGGGGFKVLPTAMGIESYLEEALSSELELVDRRQNDNAAEREMDSQLDALGALNEMAAAAASSAATTAATRNANRKTTTTTTEPRSVAVPSSSFPKNSSNGVAAAVAGVGTSSADLLSTAKQQQAVAVTGKKLRRKLNIMKKKKKEFAKAAAPSTTSRPSTANSVALFLAAAAVGAAGYVAAQQHDGGGYGGADLLLAQQLGSNGMLADVLKSSIVEAVHRVGNSAAVALSSSTSSDAAKTISESTAAIETRIGPLAEQMKDNIAGGVFAFQNHFHTGLDRVRQALDEGGVTTELLLGPQLDAVRSAVEDGIDAFVKSAAAAAATATLPNFDLQNGVQDSFLLQVENLKSAVVSASSAEGKAIELHDVVDFSAAKTAFDSTIESVKTSIENLDLPRTPIEGDAVRASLVQAGATQSTATVNTGVGVAQGAFNILKIAPSTAVNDIASPVSVDDDTLTELQMMLRDVVKDGFRY